MYKIGDRVEAVWSKGQKYPGTIISTFPNDNYEVLFDDGIKSKRKGSLIFKKKVKPPQLLSAEDYTRSGDEPSDKPPKLMPLLPPPQPMEGVEGDGKGLGETLIGTKDEEAPPILTENGNGEDCKKGFVYVQKPHYSVFDPPPKELGKRQRRVHNYSMLAKGPRLKETNGEDGKTPPGSRANSPLPTRERKRRFLKSPPTKNKVIFGERQEVVNDEEEESSAVTDEKTVGTSSSLIQPMVPVSEVPTPKSSKKASPQLQAKKSRPTPIPPVPVIPNEVTISTPATPTTPEVGSQEKKARRKRNVLTPPPILPNDEEVPAKRLRKPSLRFSADEGYVDIFKKKSRTPTASPSTNTPSPSTTTAKKQSKARTQQNSSELHLPPPQKKTSEPSSSHQLNSCESPKLPSKKSETIVKTIPMEDELLDLNEFSIPEPVKYPTNHLKKKDEIRKMKQSAALFHILQKPSMESPPVQFKKSIADLVQIKPQPPPQTIKPTRGRPPTLKLKPKVVLDRVTILEKCDNNLPPLSDVVPDQEQDDQENSGVLNYYKNKKWKKWGKGRAYPGIRNDSHSHAMHLLKRSRFQRRFESRGRPKILLLKGITKKRLKKIQESIRRRKVKRKRISVITKFKDVRVDIINCICGRTDEFGLMVQCEVCLCWQHGNCFGIFDGSNLPRFYVCQSCDSPKKVRPSLKTEGIRQEVYKKGILPTYPHAPKTTAKQQKIIKRCNDLTRMVNSIDNAIRQNRLKELIASSEPEHKKLYQWSTPRIHPKDLIQKWQFNKYYKPVVRRLIMKHKGKPEYMDKFANTVAFREKLKKYWQAFDEAKLAISRKIGSRGLILVEKLSEQVTKSDKISQIKEKLDAELALLSDSKNSFAESIDGKSMVPNEAVHNTEANPYTMLSNVATHKDVSEFLAEYEDVLYDPDEHSVNDEVELVKSLMESSKKSGIKLDFCKSHTSSVQRALLNAYMDQKFRSPQSQPNFSPRKLTELCREYLNPKNSSKTKQPTSAEEESVLSLLTLSKSGDLNGKNVSEMNIQSLRQLTERLKQNCPLGEDLAKAVVVPANGRIAHKDKTALDALLSLENGAMIGRTHNKLEEALEDVQISVHVIKRVVFHQLRILAEKKLTEKSARERGIKLSTNCLKRRVDLNKPEQYLNQVKSEYMDALMPYATHFISRFTKRDEIVNAKRNWISQMIGNYNNVKKTVKAMYSVENEDGRLQIEDKFYAALDSLRKSFDIVLTKKDIKMRRRNQSLPNTADEEEKKVTAGDTKAVSALTPNPTITLPTETRTVQALVNGHDDQKQKQQEQLPEDEEKRQLQELEILARLSTLPIQEEDVNALLGITDQFDSQESDPVSKPLELDDLRLVEENLSLKEDNLVLGGDMELINAIGSLGENVDLKGTDDSDLLLNVFDDPMFSKPADLIPCSSNSLKREVLPLSSTGPSLAKLTPEMCKGFLLDDIKANQQTIDIQLDKIEAEIMELERRRGNGLKDKDDQKLFEMLYTNMQILLENTDVLNQIVQQSVGLDNTEWEAESAPASTNSKPKALDTTETVDSSDIVISDEESIFETL